MPSRRRHSRAQVRHRFVRVSLKRRRYLERVAGFPLEQDLFDLSLGRFGNEQPYLGCRRPRCGIYHPSKRWRRGAARLAAERAWRREWAAELN